MRIKGMIKNYKNVSRFQLLLMEQILTCWIGVLGI